MAFMSPLIQGMIDGTVKSAVLLSPTNPLRKQHIDVSNALIKGIATEIKVMAIENGSTDIQARLKATKHGIAAATAEKWSGLAKEPAMKEYMENEVDIIVLDEVDEMVRNPGFFKQIKLICSICTKARVFAFTATPSDEALKFVKSLPLKSLVQLDADDADSKNHVHENITVPSSDLMPALLALVERESATKVMIFFNTSMFAEFAYHYLVKAGCKGIHMLHSKMSRGAAKKSESTFQGCSECFLLCSNLTARGMDFPKVTVVIQVGPSPPELYIQRVGRSGRGGNKGKGILLLVEEEKMAMLNALKNKVESTETKVEYSPNKITTAIQKADQGFKSLIGAYNTEARMLKWQMKDIVAVIKSIFAGAGQKIPTITKQYAKKAKVGESDGLVIEGGATFTLLPPVPVFVNNIRPVIGGRNQKPSHPAHMYAIVALSTVTIMCTILSI
jgi:superfamily II DNA/RNA helicase